MSAPKPYYETPSSAPCKVRLYLGDCREILPLVAPPSPRVIVLADAPYGIKAKTAGRGSPAVIMVAGKRRAKSARSRDFAPIAGDDAPFDPVHLLGYPRLLLWGANHYADRLPPSPSWIYWDKRGPTGSDDGADGELAWTNFGGPLRMFSHVWRGTCRASETGIEHLHPTQKPEAFTRWLLSERRGRAIAALGDLLVVPYLGSGPEIRVAIELSLDAIGIDVERAYLDTTIRHRIEPALAAGRQVALPGLGRRAAVREEQIQIGARLDPAGEAQAPLFGGPR